jgi:hypothetical protein
MHATPTCSSSSCSAALATKLLEQFPNRLRVEQYVVRTDRAYVEWVQRLVLVHGKRPPRSWATGGRGVLDLVCGPRPSLGRHT